MATRKVTDREKTIDRDKISVLNKLFENGYNTDKAILDFGLEKLNEIECTTENEILTLINLKRAIKEKRIIPFLSEGVKLIER